MSQASIITLSILLLVGLVAAVAIAVLNYTANNDRRPTTSAKAVQEMCQPTDYKEACFKSLGKVNSDDPKELVRAAFESTKDEINEVADKSEVLKELAEDPKTAEAVKDCKELFGDAINDLQRSFEEIGEFDINKVNMILENIKIWLSATLTYQETCLDGFDNTTGDASERVRKALQIAMQMSSNGLAIVNEMSILLSTLDIPSFNRRRLLNIERHVIDRDNNNVIHNWLKNRRLLSSAGDNVDSTLLEDDEPDRRRRRLLSSNNRVVGHDDDDLIMPAWLDGRRRKLLESTNLAEDLKAKANVVVALDGSGKYKTIEQALQDIPKYGNESFIVYIKQGVYNEYLVLYKWMTHLVFVGDGPTKTRITNNKNFADGTKTFKTATLSVLGDFFMAKDIGIENSAGAIKHQAVALRVQSDQSIFYNCHMDGYQDTLYTHTYRQYYRDCRVTGTIDFIFGDAAAFFQNCTLVVRKPLDNQRCIVTAQGRMERHQPTGIIIHKSRFEADPDYYPIRKKNTAYLGRPWKEYSKTIIMESHIDDLIAPDGWLPWEGTFALETCYYGEYNNVGLGSDMSNRVKWRGIKHIVHDHAEKFMPPYLYENDEWIRASGVPYDPYLSALAPGPALGLDEDPNAPEGAPLVLPSYISGFASVFSSSSSSDHSSSSSSSSSLSSLSSLFTSSSSSSSSSHSHSHSSPSSSGQSLTSSSSNDHSSSSNDNLSSSSFSSSSSSSSGSSSEGSSSSSGASSETPSTSSSTSSLSTPVNNNDTSKNTTNGNEIQSSGQGPTEQGSKGTSSYTTAPSTPTSTPETTVPTPITEAPTPTPEYSPLNAAVVNLSPAPTPTPTISTSSSPLLVPTTSPTETISMELSPNTSPSYGLSSSSTETKRKLTGPVTIHELERILMTNEELEEGDQVNDDMSGNVPDGDEPSPAMVEHHSIASAPSTVLSPSSAESISSPNPSLFDEVSDLLSPATAPEPKPADELPPPASPKSNNARSNSKLSDLHMILSWVIMWVALTM